MTENEYKYFEILNAAAMKAEQVNSDGTFVFKDEYVASLLKKDARKNQIDFDEASAKDEFKIENRNIIIFPNYERALASISMDVNCDKKYCYFSTKLNRLVILCFDENCNPYSFYFSDNKNIEINMEFSLSNIVYWKKIYNLLCKNICDGLSDSDRSFFINSFEKGKCIFEYSNYNEQFNSIDLHNTYNKFLSVLELTKLYPMLFKNRCVEHLSSSGKSTLKNLISELDGICNKVKIDFAIFVEKIDFDSHIQKYNERLENFISQARTIIEKMLSNIFTLPLTYAGAIFAFDKLSDNSFAPFIFIAMCFYTVFSCGFLIYEFVDTFSLNKNYAKEISFYTNDSPILLEKVEPDKKNFRHRVIGIRIICLFLIAIFLLLLVYLGICFFKGANIVTTC